MSRHILIFTMGYYQTMLAIRMKQTLFEKESVDIIITDSSVGGKVLATNLKGMTIFNNVYYMKSFTHCRPEVKKTRVGKFEGLQCCITGHSKRIRSLIGDIHVDEFVFFDVCIESLALYAYLSKDNHVIYVSIMEEGFSSYYNIDQVVYSRIGKNRQLLYKIRRLLDKGNLTDSIYKIYVRYPQILAKKSKLKAIQIPPINMKDETYKKMVMQAFGVSEIEEDYSNRIIYMSNTNQEEDIAALQKLSNIFGKKNIIVKLHPRNYSNTISELGYKVVENTELPWEIFALMCDMSGSILISELSNSTLSVYAMGQKVKLIYLGNIYVEGLKSYYLPRAIHNQKRILKTLKVNKGDYLFANDWEDVKRYANSNNN